MIRDSVDGFNLPDELLQKHHNVCRTIDGLNTGLDFINGKVAGVEQTMIDAAGGGKLAGFGLLDLRIEYMLGCSFHWYAVGACNVVRLTAWLRRQNDPGAPDPKKYTRSVLKEVLDYRNKIAAHPVIEDDDEKNFAIQEVSAMFGTSFEGDAFYSPPFSIKATRSGKTKTSEKLKPWSLTKVHAALRARYINPATSD